MSEKYSIEVLATKIDAIEDSIRVAHEDMVRVPTEIQKQVVHVMDAIGYVKDDIKNTSAFLEKSLADSDKLKDEKFRNIDKRLDLVEQARIEQKKDTATAVDAALKAAKEAVTEQNTSNVLAINKSEAATTKQIDQQSVLVNQIKENFESKIADIKKEISDIRQTLSQTKGKGEGYDKFIYLAIAAASILWAIFGK